jgi:SAM-dependent methyltransferase
MAYEIPPQIVAVRRDLAERYLKGEGIEIGALHFPLPIPAAARVRYVDRMSVSDLRLHYPELSDMPLGEVDVIDDGERLDTFADRSLDFVIANHFLEHCENPIATVHSHLRKVKRGGVLYYAIPDRRFSFDKDRRPTSLPHLLRDHLLGTHTSRLHHFREWVTLVEKRSDPNEAHARFKELLDQNYSIHFHVWDPIRFRVFLTVTWILCGTAFHLVHFGRNETEVIAILTAR